MMSNCDFETVINEYWMYVGEPFSLVRFTYKGDKYLTGLNGVESAGVEKSRTVRGYKKPTLELLQELKICGV